jgi:hypothetical protein
MEETISTWIEDDVEQIVSEHEKQWEARLRATEEEYRKRQVVVEPPPKSGLPAAAVRTKPKPAPAAPVVAKPAEPVKPKVVEKPRPEPAVEARPAELPLRGPTPRLAVESCTQSGVTLAFESTWLEHMGFRASMPIRCVFSGEEDHGKLLARPLAFVDRSQASVRNPQELEGRYARNLGSQTAREWIALTGVMERLPKPFNQPMPYYSIPQHQHTSLSCSTVVLPDGSILCKVLIPDGRYALDWLLRVNGVCGPEYAQLEADVAMLWSDAWGKLSEETRRRIDVWCSFQPGEKFRHYILDADFNRIDNGLAGVVVTNQRLVFCKYHHRGQVALAEEGTLVAQVHGEFVELMVEAEGHRTRVGRLHTGDLPALQEALDGATGLKLQRVEG